MKSLTRVRPKLVRNQSGVNMVGLITWMFLATIVMGGVVALFTETSKQTAIGAEQNQQQQSILNALNRVSRDVSISNPIVYASPTEIVVDVNKEDGSVERRRYVLNTLDKEVWEYSHTVKRGDPYDLTTINTYWTTNPDRMSKTVYNVNIDAAEDNAFLRYFDGNGQEIIGVISTSKDAEAVARVDINLTADVANKGNVSLSTSAVPRATTNLGAEAQPILAPCPAFTATHTGNTVVLRWDKASDEVTSYEITRNGVTIQPTTVVSDTTKLKYTYTDTPGTSSTVMNYMLKVVSAAGISNCIDSVRPIVITADSTQLTVPLVPETTFDSFDNPISTAWSNAGETTKVKVTWQKVDIASGYVISRQQLDNSGAPIGGKYIEATLENYPYVDQNASILAPAELSYLADVKWDEHWEWSIKVLSRSGENDLTPEIRSISYPHPLSGDASNPDTSLSVSAVPIKASDPNRVSDADLAAGFGNTRLTWTYDNGMEMRGFDIYRSAIDAPAANFPAGFNKIGSVGTDDREFIDRRAELGSTYGYYVVPKNKSGFSNSYVSKRVQQLQFPPDAVMVPVGVNGSRDLNDGTNRVMWNPAKSATGYHIERFTLDLKTVLCLSAPACTPVINGLSAGTTQFDDSRSDVDPATRFSYSVHSYNATGFGPQRAAKATLTQRPIAPTLNKTSSPTPDSLNTSMSWNHTAGTWCVPGAYTGLGGGNACGYEERQYHINGVLRHAGTDYVTSFSWGNQDWGRHYTYNVRAQNAAITNGGWSELSGTVAADTYPAPIGVVAWNGDNTGGQAQRINYESSVGNGGWGDVSQAGYTTLSWGHAYGAGRIDIVRVHDGWQATSGNASLLLPAWDTVGGVLSGDNAANRTTMGTWSSIAAPGTTYRYDLTATSFENNLTRRVSTGNTITPADVPRAGAVQIVCAGPGNGDGTGLSDAPRQKIAARTMYTDLPARYGYYETTYIEKLWTPWKGSGLLSNGWVGVPWGQGGDGILSSNGVGYHHQITNGFNFVNAAAGRTDSATLSNFSIYLNYSFTSGCPPEGAPMEEPPTACYVAAYSGCSALNPEDRPKWKSR